MKKTKNKLIKNKPEVSLTENNLFQNLFRINGSNSEFKDDNISETKSSNFDIASIYLNKNKHNDFNNTHFKFSKFSKTLFNNKKFPYKIKIKKPYTKTQSNDSRKILPYLQLTNRDSRQNPNLLKTFDLNNSKRNKTIEKTNDWISKMKPFFNKNEIQKGEFPKKIKIRDDSKFKYSIMLKNLDVWDQDHCDENKNDNIVDLFNILYDFFKKNNLTQEKNDLIYASNIIKSRENNSYEVDEANNENKIFMDLFKKRRLETGTILKNNLYRTQLKFSELFDKKYTKAFNENLDIDPDTFNLLLEDEMKNIFYNQIIKDRMKYEKQLHEDLLKINGIIYKRKIAKEEKTLKSKEFTKELHSIRKEYNDKYTKNRKIYWNRYDSYEQYYKSLMNNNNLNISKQLRKMGENDDFLETQTHLSINKPNLEEKKIFRSPGPRKRRTSYIDRNTLSIYKSNMKKLEDEKKFKLLHMNNEMNYKLKEIQTYYEDKIEKIMYEQKKLEKDLKIHKLELHYYKKINDQLVREHKVYYMNKLKKGYDCRKEGLTWVVYNLFELKVNLDYHHFPKYLTHEHIDYLKKYAKLQLKQDELKIIINVLKKKQNTQKMNDLLKMMDVVDNIIDVDVNTKIEADDENAFTNKDFLASKIKIDKKFFKIYQDNIDVMKNYLFKNVETYELHKVINEFKKDLYHGSNSDINKSKRDVLNVFMGDKNNKNFFEFLLNVKASLQKIEDEKEKLFQNEKNNFLKLVENNMSHKASINNVVKNEMIKRCLFGNKLDI